jgi:hypothetical protein
MVIYQTRALINRYLIAKSEQAFLVQQQISLYELDGEFRLKHLVQIKLMPANPIYKFISFEVSLSR